MGKHRQDYSHQYSMPYRSLKMRHLFKRMLFSEPISDSRLAQTEKDVAPYIFPLTTELIWDIVEYLEPNDLLNVRVVCKDLHQKTLHCYGLTFLKSVHTDLTPSKIQKLEAVSNNKQMGPYVRKLHMMSSCLVIPYDPDRLTEIRLSRCRAIVDNISRLENCRSFEITNWLEWYPVDDNGSIIDIIQALEVSASLLTILVQRGLLAKSFTFCCKILLTNECTTPKRVFRDLLLNNPLNKMNLGSQGAWAQLEEVCLDIRDTEGHLEWLGDLFRNALHLQKVSLHLFTPGLKFEDDMLTNQICLGSTFPDLHTLNMSYCDFSLKALSRFILHCAENLRVLSLVRMNIINGENWRTILSLLQSNCPLLETICLKWLSSSIENSRDEIQFPEIMGRPGISKLKGITLARTVSALGEERIFGVDYSGPHMSELLDGLIDTAEPC